MNPAPGWYRWRGEDLELRVRVRPGAARDETAGMDGDALRIRVQAPPVEGRANQRACAFLAELFGVPKSRVRIARGQRSRTKRVLVERPGRLPPELPIRPSTRKI